MDLATRRIAYVQRLDEATRRAVETLSQVAGVERVSVFGSYARGRRDLFTDLDLLVVWRTDRPALDRLRYLHSILDVGVDLDVVCYTPEELRTLSDHGFVRQIRAEEVVLYEGQPR
jgi:predicted nucleotidyltransferase